MQIATTVVLVWVGAASLVAVVYHIVPVVLARLPAPGITALQEARCLPVLAPTSRARAVVT